MLQTILNSLTKSKNMAETLPEGIEKIVQYGKKVLKITTPESSTEILFNNGAIAPKWDKSAIQSYIDAGWKPVGKRITTNRSVHISGGENPEQLVIRKVVDDFGANNFYNGTSESIVHAVGGKKPQYSVLTRRDGQITSYIPPKSMSTFPFI